MMINNKDLAIGILGASCMIFGIEAAYYKNRCKKVNEIVTKAANDLLVLCNKFVISNDKTRKKDESENKEDEG